MRMEPRLAWAHIHLLAKGKSAHHQQKTTMGMHLPDGTGATNASENIFMLSLHFHKVFNTHRTTDPSLLDHVCQQQTLWELDDPITWTEFNKAMTKLKDAKAQGLTGVLPEAFKAMSPSNL